MMLRFSSILWCTVLTVTMLVGCQTTSRFKDPVRLGEALPVDPGLYQGTLDNGFRYWIRSTNASGSNHTIHLRLIVGVGSVDEAEDERGYTHLLEHVLFRAVDQDSGLQSLIREAGLSWGAGINAFTFQDRTEYRFSFSGEHSDIVPRALKFSALLLDNVKVLDKHLQAEKPIIEAEWRSRQASNSDAPGKFMRALVGDTRWLHRPPQGNLGDLRAATRASVQRYWDKHYQPRNATLIVTGKIDPVQLRQQISTEFSGLENRAATADSVPGLNRLPSRQPIEVVSFEDITAKESYVRGYYFLPLEPVTSYGSLRTTVLDDLAVEVIYQSQTSRFKEHPQCVGYRSFRTVAARRSRLVYFELVPIDRGGFVTCASILQGAFKGIAELLNERGALRSLRRVAVDKVQGRLANLRYQSSDEMVHTLTQQALRGDSPMSPALVYREFDALVSTISSTELKNRITQILEGPVLYAFGSPSYSKNLLPDNNTAVAQLKNVGPLTSRKVTDSRKTEYEPVPPGATIVSEDSGEQWSLWKMSNGVTVAHFPAKGSNTVAMHLIDAGGFASLPNEWVDEGQYLPRYHDDAAFGGMTAAEADEVIGSNNMHLQSTISSDRHSLAGAVYDARAAELFKAFATVLQPLRITGQSDSFIARTQQWQQSRKGGGSQRVFQHYWDRMVSGAPSVLSGDTTAELTANGYVNAHKLLFQTARQPVVAIYGDIKASSVRARLVNTFGAIEPGGNSGSGIIYKMAANAPTGKHVVVGGRRSAGALTNTADTHLFHHCSNQSLTFPQFVDASEVLARLVEGRVTDRIREDLGIAYAPEVLMNPVSVQQQVVRFYIRITSAQPDEARVRTELGELLDKIAKNGFSRQEVNAAIKALNTDYRLNSKYSSRRVEQIAKKLFYGAAPSAATQLTIDLGGDAVDVIAQSARECFGQHANRPLTVTHSSSGSS